jgi:hypothetical protein
VPIHESQPLPRRALEAVLQRTTPTGLQNLSLTAFYLRGTHSQLCYFRPIQERFDLAHFGNTPIDPSLERWLLLGQGARTQPHRDNNHRHHERFTRTHSLRCAQAGAFYCESRAGVCAGVRSCSPLQRAGLGRPSRWAAGRKSMTATPWVRCSTDRLGSAESGGREFRSGATVRPCGRREFEDKAHAVEFPRHFSHPESGWETGVCRNN